MLYKNKGANLKPTCEKIVQEVLPTVRALVARDLIEVHGLTQKDAAKKLGMTQPAISQYKRELRGKKIIEDEEVLQEIKNIASKIASGEYDSSSASLEFCEICKLIRRKNNDYSAHSNC